MPTEKLSAGLPTTVSQSITYAMPACRVWVVSNAVLEFSLQSTTGFAAVAASTTGMESAWPFARCTTASPIVSVQKM